MELELDLKVSKTMDDLHSTDFRFARHRAGPVFLSHENANMFFLTAHLRGYTKEYTKIAINEDGTLISISGNKMVQETALNAWMTHKKEPEMKGFIKVYKIPLGVVLDKIKADYNDDESTLTIYMPKQKKGIIGGGIEEVKDHENQVNDETLHEEQILSNVEDITSQEENSKSGNGPKKVVPMTKGKYHMEEVMPFSKDQEQVSLIGESKGEAYNVSESENQEIVEDKLDDGFEQKDENNKDDKCLDQHEMDESYYKDNKCNLFAPCFFIGSTLIASLVALFLSLVKPKRH